MSVSIDKIEFKNYRQYGTGTIHFSTPGEYNLSVLIAKTAQVKLRCSMRLHGACTEKSLILQMKAGHCRL